MKKILVLEDMPGFLDIWRKDLPEEYELVVSVTCSAAWKRFTQDPEAWAAIVCDENLPMSKPGHEFVQAVRAYGYGGPIVAISSDEKGQENLCAAGCNFKAGKLDVAERLLQILN